MVSSSTCFIVSACFITIYHYFTQVILFSILLYITHLFQITKCTLHAIAGTYIVLMQNSFNVQF